MIEFFGFICNFLVIFLGIIVYYEVMEVFWVEVVDFFGDC